MKSKISDFQKTHRTKWHDFLWSKFLDQFSNTKSKTAINVIFSPYEKRLITKRLAALALIKSGCGSREICRLLWISRSTITALKKVVLGKSGSYISQRFLKRKNLGEGGSDKLMKHSWLDDLFKGIDLWELIKNPPRPGRIF